MSRRRRMLAAVLLALSMVVVGGCYGTGTTYVGVYGPSVYGPSPWGGYPYPGRYPPVGGGVWVGAPMCCEEEQDEERAPDAEASTESAQEAEPLDLRPMAFDPARR